METVSIPAYYVDFLEDVLALNIGMTPICDPAQMFIRTMHQNIPLTSSFEAVERKFGTESAKDLASRIDGIRLKFDARREETAQARKEALEEAKAAKEEEDRMNKILEERKQAEKVDSAPESE